MKLIGIYCIRCKQSGKCYIGQSVNISKLVRYHFGGWAESSYIDRSIQKHGKDAFAVEILELCEESELNTRECHWIASLDAMTPKGYNLRLGGDGGGRPSEETRQKLSVVNSKRVTTPETRQKLSKAMTGRKLSDETRRKISEAQKGDKSPNFGKKLPSETCRKMSEAVKGNKNPNFGKSTWITGKKHSAETKRKMSESHKGKKVSAETRRKLSEASKRNWQKKRDTSE